MSYSEIVCLVDRSGSMHPVRTDTVGGFNAFLEAQQADPEPARLTVVFFNDLAETALDRVDLHAALPMPLEAFVPSSTTALLDALGGAVYALKARLDALPEFERPRRVVLAVLTDGEENASRHFARAQVADSLAARRAEGWQFVFLAANQDAVLAAEAVGLAAEDAVAFEHTAEGTSEAFGRMAAEVTRRRG